MEIPLRSMLLVFSLCSLSLAAQANTPPFSCGKNWGNGPQLQLNYCSWQAYQQQNEKLNKVYKKVMHKMHTWDHPKYPIKGAPNMVRELRQAEISWISYKEQFCKLDADESWEGSMQPMVHAQCLTSLTEAQIKNLNGLMMNY